MAVRISGLASGLDTDSIVQELVSAYQYKVDSYEKDKTLLEWKEEAWSDLNQEVNSFYKSYLSSMRLQGNYTKQTVGVSDTTKATVSSDGASALGVQSLNIIQMAKAGYLTGAELAGATTSTTLADLGYTGGETTLELTVGGETTSITVSQSTTISEVVNSISAVSGISVNFDTTNCRIFVASSKAGAENDFVLTGVGGDGMKALNALGLCVETDTTNAYYDAWLGTGDSSISWIAYTTDADGNQIIDETTTKENLTNLVETISQKLAEITQNNTNISSEKDTITELQARIDCATAYKNIAAANQEISDAQTTMGLGDDDFEKLKTFVSAAELTEDEITEFEALKAQILTNMQATDSAYTEDDVETMLTELSSNIAALTENQTTIASYEASYNESGSDILSSRIEAIVAGTDDEYADYDAFVAQCETEISDCQTRISEAESNISTLETELEAYSTLTDAAEITEGIETDSDALAAVVDALYNKTAEVYDAYTNTVYNTDANRVDAQDAIIVLNGVEYTSNTNTFTVNGLTVTALGVTGSGTQNELTITTSYDTDGVYSMIKEFFSNYNTLINSMTASYNADSAKGYEPLSDDEKESMSEEEIEKWETKIKDALLRRDSTLQSLMSLFTSSLSKSYYILDGKAVTYSSKYSCYMYNGEAITDSNGNKITTESGLSIWATKNGAERYSLSSFGISTLGYLNAADNEQYAYHIDGDSEDSDTSGNTDKLKAALNSDPDTVSAFFSALISDTYASLNDRMTSTDLNSKYSVYNDKQLDKEMDDIEDKIETWEERLEELEDYWYDKFSAMETALATLQSQQSSLSSLLGSSS